MPKITLRTTGLHEMLGGDCGIEEPSRKAARILASSQ